MSDTIPESRPAPEPLRSESPLPELPLSPESAGCPVDHRAIAAAAAHAAPRCPVDHEAVDHEVVPSRPTSTCSYAPGAGKRGYFVPGLIAFLALLLGGALIDAFAMSHGSSGQLPGPLVASQIATSVQERTAGTPTPSVRCPASEPVAAGVVFTCGLSDKGGATRQVTVTETGGGRFGFVVGPGTVAGS